MKDEKELKDNQRKVLFAVCIVVCILCAVYIASYYIKKNKKQDDYKVVQKEVEKEIEEAKVEEKPKEEIPIDFASLKQTNDEIYAWITIPDTNINYPVVQRPLWMIIIWITHLTVKKVLWVQSLRIAIIQWVFRII